MNKKQIGRNIQRIRQVQNITHIQHPNAGRIQGWKGRCQIGLSTFVKTFINYIKPIKQNETS